MPRLALLCCLLLFAPVRPLLAQGLMPSKGVNDVTWGARLDKTPGFHALATQDAVAILGQEQNDYRLGGFGMVKVFYATRDGVFFAAYIRMKSVDMYQQIHNTLKLELGQPEKSGDMSLDVSRWSRPPLAAYMQRNKATDASRLSYVNLAHGDEASRVIADALFDSLNTGVMDQDTWKNTQRFDLNFMRQ